MSPTRRRIVSWREELAACGDVDHPRPELPMCPSLATSRAAAEAASLDTAVDTEVFPHFPDGIPPGVVEAGRYRLRFAWTRADLHAAQALRFAVFNEELGEGLAEAAHTGRDADERDPSFHHLLIEERTTGTVVGTYRLQTALMAATRHGFYGATLFELATLPARVLAEAVEIGRACVHPAHRSGRVIQLLWRGLARYLQWNGKRYLFGCCSLPGVDTNVARHAWSTVHARDALHATLFVRPRPAARALPDDGRTVPRIEGDAGSLPPLFESYLALGARVCGPPAVDRSFGTTDCLVLLDVHAMPAHAFCRFFA
jgi:putative hemolysin